MSEIAIQCRGIKKTYGYDDNRVEALKGIDLDVPAGKLTLLVGPSGSGKTTLLSIITTILTPDAGELHLLGVNPFQLSETDKAAFCRNNLGIVFQSLFLIPTLTVTENVSLPLLIDGYTQEQATQMALAMLTTLNLMIHAHASPANLSKGQQQRVAIARAMVREANIIICDEPTSALDQAKGHDIMDHLHHLSLEQGKTVLVVTHDHRIFPLADHIVSINDGLLTGKNE